MAATSRGERWAAMIVLAVGVPLVFLFTRAIADGETRRRQAPVRALIGDGAFEALARGEKTEVHYMGNSLSAPDFTLRDRAGQPWTLSQQRGKVVLMNFWSITCPPCVEEMPSLSALAEMAERREDLEVVAVTTDESWDVVKSVVPPGSKLKVLFDSDKSVVENKFGSKMFPETWVIDRRGVIRLRVDGKRDWSAPLSLEVIESYL